MDEHDPRYFMVTDLARDAANMMLWDRHLMRIAASAFQITPEWLAQASQDSYHQETRHKPKSREAKPLKPTKRRRNRKRRRF